MGILKENSKINKLLNIEERLYKQTLRNYLDSIN